MPAPDPLRLHTHGVTLTGGRLRLRPLTEADWGVLLPWYQDAEVLYYAEGDAVTSRSLEEVQDIYQWVPQTAWCFIMEYDTTPIGECWLQQMNVPLMFERFPGEDLRRIDLCIGDKAWWGRGLGTRAIGMLVRFGFDQGADRLFACHIADYNPRSRRAFERNGFCLIETTSEPPGAKARLNYTLALARDDYLRPMAR